MQWLLCKGMALAAYLNTSSSRSSLNLRKTHQVYARDCGDGGVGYDPKWRLQVEPQRKLTRKIYMIRHGRYNQATNDHSLDPLGRKQAKEAGAYLGRKNVHFNHVYVSNMTRARQTWAQMNEHVHRLPRTPAVVTKYLQEGTLGYSTPIWSTNYGDDINFWGDVARLEYIYRKIVCTAEAEVCDGQQIEHSNTLIVCHANVIRYFVLRALQLPVAYWSRLNPCHSSVTSFTIKPNGVVQLDTFSDPHILIGEDITYDAIREASCA